MAKNPSGKRRKGDSEHSAESEISLAIFAEKEVTLIGWRAAWLLKYIIPKRFRAILPRC